MPPRLVIAGLSGESGKTLVSLGILLAASQSGLPVRAFKKGPDYIDAAWLAWASGRPARSLDSYLMGFTEVTRTFVRHSLPDGLNLIEGNRGLFDGVDAKGTHSTAELAKALRAPVVLVVNVSKVTRTTAALVLGCQKLDADVPIAGVILNRIGSPRHEQVIREAIESECGLPVLGAVPRMESGELLPGRHLGLVTPEEHAGKEELRANLASLARNHLDLERLVAIAKEAPSLVGRTPASAPDPLVRLPNAGEGAGRGPGGPPHGWLDGRGLKIGYLKDSAFTFYYPENLEALESAGAELAAIDAVAGSQLPAGLDALYIGGGFPETHAARLASNGAFLASIREGARRGLPIYAECGGLMLLARSIVWNERTFRMAGVLPFDVEVCSAPQGHGYARLQVDGPNAFFPQGTVLKGHEFHYSRILLEGRQPPTAFSVIRGTGCFAGRDGVVAGNVLASYVHLHAAAAPEWAKGLLEAARNHASKCEVSMYADIIR
jgi:cobyrinic acid a,c-diamide synthase